MSTPAHKINDFITNTKAFEQMPKNILTFTKNKLLSDNWIVYRFDARVKNDEGWEVDADFFGGTYFASYCWCDNDEYCITSKDYFEKQVSKTYKTEGIEVFKI